LLSVNYLVRKLLQKIAKSNAIVTKIERKIMNVKLPIPLRRLLSVFVQGVRIGGILYVITPRDSTFPPRMNGIAGDRDPPRKRGGGEEGRNDHEAPLH
jgi:hypothetical protein